MPGARRANLVHHLHRLDDEQRLTLGDGIADPHVGRLARLCGEVGDADQRRRQRTGVIVAIGARVARAVRAGRRRWLFGGQRWARRCGGGRRGAVAGDMDALVADRVFDLAKPGLVQQLGQRADQIGIGRQLGTAAAEHQWGASLAAASISVAMASSASS